MSSHSIVISGSEIDNTVAQILEVFARYRRISNLATDEYSTTGKDVLRQRLHYFVSQDKPISFVLPGFPMKSPNAKEKVLGTLPDMAEQVAFRTINRFCRAIESIYGVGGIEFNILSDGYVFGDIVGVPEETVVAYEAESKKMIGNPSVHWQTLCTFYPGGDTSSKVTRLMQQHGINESELEQRITNDPDINMLYCGMKQFMVADRVWPAGTTTGEKRRYGAEKAREMMRRNEAYSGLIDSQYKNSIRLSIHPSTNYGHKYSFGLIEGDDGWRTPWHTALLVTQTGRMQLVKKIEAEKAGHELRFEQNRPFFYQERPGNLASNHLTN